MTEAGRSITCRSLDFDRSWISAKVEDTDPTTSLWTVVCEPDDPSGPDAVIDVRVDSQGMCGELHSKLV